MKSSIYSNYLFSILLLLSGFAGISYEILYGRILGNMIGDQFVVSASVLMTFLLGIGLGALLAHRLWRWLWAIEAGIGVYGILVALNQQSLEWLIYQGSGMVLGGLSGSILVCVLILLLPACLMGCSVPLFAGYLSHMRQGDRSSFTWVYMIYNAGAAFTALLIEFYVIRHVGIQGAVMVFAWVNILIAALLWYQFNTVREHVFDNTPSWQSMLRKMPTRIWIALLLASMASAIFQLWMVKYAELIFGPFRESFALVLALILMGITLGSWLVHRLNISFSRLMWVNLLGLLALMWMGSVFPYLYAALYDLTGNEFWHVIALKGLFLSILMLLPAITFGATVPALLSHREELSHESGLLLALASFANVFGFLLMVFGLHPFLDYGVQLLVMVLLVTLAWVVYCSHTWRTWLSVGVLLVMVAWVYEKQWDEDLLYLSYTNFKDDTELSEARESVSFPDRYKGYQDVFSINWMEGDPYFFINGYISIPLNNPSEKIVGGLSTLFAPTLDHALVLGLGSGATAPTVGLFLKHTDVIEINPVVRENLFRMKQWNFDIEHNPHVKIMVDDAIHYVKSMDKTYALILNTVTTPLYFSSSKLYTKNFFDDVKKRLTKGGVYVTWMDSRIGDKGADIILRSLHQSFKHGALAYVKGSYFLLIASDDPLVMHQQKAVTTQPELRKNLLEKHAVVSAWLPYQLMTTDLFSLIGNGEGSINTADNPILEFEMARLQNKHFNAFKKRLLAHISVEEIKSAMPMIGDGFPAPFVLQANNRLRNSSITRRWKALLPDKIIGKEKALAELARRKVQAELKHTAQAWHHYAYQLIEVENYSLAIKAIQHELSLDPSFNDANYNLGVCYELLNQPEKALQAFERELSVDSNDKDVRYRIARLLVKKGDYQQALVLLNAYIENNALKHGRAFFYRGLVFHALGDEAQAKKDLMKAMRLRKSERALTNRLHVFGY
ncbi:MAG: tetratricopeptide repeat protein [Mariprofundaceae bacterium]|nr:tetratricopeptide repeat protein [Mariprofundaceae bacterium]